MDYMQPDLYGGIFPFSIVFSLFQVDLKLCWPPGPFTLQGVLHFNHNMQLYLISESVLQGMNLWGFGGGSEKTWNFIQIRYFDTDKRKIAFQGMFR